jgi:hypothetical protein
MKPKLKNMQSRTLFLFLVSLMLIAATMSMDNHLTVKSLLTESKPVANAIPWYLNTTDWINVTLTQGFRLALDRNSGLIHWYWPSNPLQDRGVDPWGGIRVETWGYNDGQEFEHGIETSLIESSTGSWILVNETWVTNSAYETRVELYMVFYRDAPCFYCYARQTYLSEPNSTNPSYWFHVGNQPQICFLLRDSTSIFTPSPFNETKVNTGELMPVTYQWMEQFQKFPWVAMHAQSDNASLGVIVLNVDPPSYDMMGRGGGTAEAQITFMAAGIGDLGESWFFPDGFSWYTQFMVYPDFDHTPPYYDEIDDLSKSLYSLSYEPTNFDTAFTSASDISGGSNVPEEAQIFVLNRIGGLDGLFGRGLIFWNGTTPRNYYSNFPDNYMLVFDQDFYEIDYDALNISGYGEWNSTIAGTDSRSGYHVQCWKLQDFNYSLNGVDASLKHTWEAWNDSDKFLWTTTFEVGSDSEISSVKFWLDKGSGNVIELNSTAWELYYPSQWGDEPAVTLIFQNATVDYSNGKWTYWLVNNTSQQHYSAGDKVSVSFLLWLHYGHITDVSQITPLHTIQPQHIAPFHSHFYRSIRNYASTADFSFWTDATFIDANIAYLQSKGELTVVQAGKNTGMTKIYCANFGIPEKATVNGQNATFEYDASTKVLTLSVDFAQVSYGIATVVVEFPDVTPPTTELLIGSPNFNKSGNIYVGSATQFALSFQDTGFGVAYTSSRVDSQSWVNYSAPFNLGGYDEGEHTIMFFSVDKTSNTESTRAIRVTLDYSPPTTMCSPAAGSYSERVTVNLSSIDTASGVRGIYYRVDSDSQWVNYTGPFNVTGSGTHTVYYYSVDNLGNQESFQSTSYVINSSSWTTIAVVASIVVVFSVLLVLIVLNKRGMLRRHTENTSGYLTKKLTNK